jgi:hypothetical protein
MPLPMQARIRELEAERDQFAAGVALICCDERHDAKVRGLEAQLVISRAAAGERADILEGARDLLESAGHNGAHGDDWPDINPSLEALIAERDQLRAGMEAVWTRWFLNAHDGLTFREAMTGLATDVRAVLDGKPMNAGRTTPDNPLTSTNGVDNPAAEPHTYLSTGCLHGDHGYCQSNTGAAGTKTPAQCKFCAAPCCCDCHQAATP